MCPEDLDEIIEEDHTLRWIRWALTQEDIRTFQVDNDHFSLFKIPHVICWEPFTEPEEGEIRPKLIKSEIRSVYTNENNETWYNELNELMDQGYKICCVAVHDWGPMDLSASCVVVTWVTKDGEYLKLLQCERLKHALLWFSNQFHPTYVKNRCPNATAKYIGSNGNDLLFYSTHSNSPKIDLQFVIYNDKYKG